MEEIIRFDEPLPWERQNYESAVEFECFQIYRDLPPHERSLSRVQSELQSQEITIQNLTAWSSRNSWKTRGLAWDDHKDDLRREEMAQRVRDNAIDITDKADKAIKMLFAATEEWHRRKNSSDIVESQELEMELKKLTATQLTQLVMASARPIQMFWEAQKEAMGVAVQHLMVQKRAEKSEDPFATDDEYAKAVIMSWVEAGLIPDPFAETAQIPSETQLLEQGTVVEENPEPTVKKRHVRKVVRPQGRLDDGRGIIPQ